MEKKGVWSKEVKNIIQKRGGMAKQKQKML